MSAWIALLILALVQPLMLFAFYGTMLIWVPSFLFFIAVRIRHLREIEVAYVNSFSPTEQKIDTNSDLRSGCLSKGVSLTFIGICYFIFSSLSQGRFREQELEAITPVPLTLGIAAFAWSSWNFSKYFRWEDDPSRLCSVLYNYDHVVAVYANGNRRAFLIDSNLQITVSCDQVSVGIWPIRWYRRTELVLCLKDHVGEVRIPYGVDGCGQFLEICRRSGAKIEFLTETRTQRRLANFAKTVSKRWVPPSSSTSVLREPSQEMACGGCGAKAMYERAAAKRACDYCGAAKLTPV